MGRPRESKNKNSYRGRASRLRSISTSRDKSDPDLRASESDESSALHLNVEGFVLGIPNNAADEGGVVCCHRHLSRKRMEPP